MNLHMTITIDLVATWQVTPCVSISAPVLPAFVKSHASDLAQTSQGLVQTGEISIGTRFPTAVGWVWNEIMNLDELGNYVIPTIILCFLLLFGFATLGVHPT